MDGFDTSHARCYIGGCVALVTVPFFIAGVNVLRAGIQAMHRHEEGAPFLLSFGIAFTAFSLGFVAMTWWTLRQGQTMARRMDVHTGQPWLWRHRPGAPGRALGFAPPPPQVRPLVLHVRPSADRAGPVVQRHDRASRYASAGCGLSAGGVGAPPRGRT